MARPNKRYYFQPGEEQRIADALDALEKDVHAPRSISVQLVLEVHREYPRALYRGSDSRLVSNIEEQAVAIAEGYRLSGDNAQREAEANGRPKPKPRAWN